MLRRPMCLLLTAIAFLLTTTAAFAAEDDMRLFWRDVTVRLQGALPNTNPKLGKTEDIFLGRLDAAEGKPARWRPWVLGYSAIFRYSKHIDQYTWMDHEGTLLEAKEEGDTIRLVVEMDVKADAWVKGGKGKWTITLKRSGEFGTDLAPNLAGTFEGVFDKRECPVSGPGGKFECKGAATGWIRPKLWPAPVANFKPLAPGEHPRLLFRKHDLPVLRERAKTPEGQAILKRLRLLLGGGEQMPTQFNNATAAYGGGSKVEVGGYTNWHGVGFGLLYQITGDAKYAELARQCVELARKGQRDRDQRYSYVRPGGKLRAGPSYAGVAMAYDLCYDAWEPAYRKALAAEMQNKVFRTHKTAGGEDGGTVAAGEGDEEKAMSSTRRTATTTAPGTAAAGRPSPPSWATKAPTPTPSSAAGASSSSGPAAPSRSATATAATSTKDTSAAG